MSTKLLRGKYTVSSFSRALRLSESYYFRRVISEREIRAQLKKEKEEVSCFEPRTSVGRIFIVSALQREAKEKKEVCSIFQRIDRLPYLLLTTFLIKAEELARKQVSCPFAKTFETYFS